MPVSATETAHPAEKTGLIAHFSALLAAQLAYLKARLELAGIEGKEAAIHLAIILGFAIGALVLAAFGYVLLVIAVVFLIARAFDNPHAWMWVLACVALFHFVAAGVCLLIARLRLGRPLFPLTLEELKKDQEWLKTNAKSN